MLGWHIVIGIGEAVITGLVVGSVVAVRPDLVHGARPRAGRRARSRSARAARTTAGRGMRPRTFLRRRPPGHAAARRRRQLLRLRQPRRARARRRAGRASATRREQPPAADGPLAGYETTRRRGRPAGSRRPRRGARLLVVLVLDLGCSGSRRLAPADEAGPTPTAPTSAPEGPRRWAPDTATGCTSTATPRSTGRRPHLKVAGAARVRAGRGRDAHGLVRRLRRLPASCSRVVVAVSQVPPAYLLKRMVVEVPVRGLRAAAAVRRAPARGPRCSGSRVSEPGLLAAWALLAKGTLGVLASLTLAATTEPRDLLAGLERLRRARTSSCRSWAS